MGSKSEKNGFWVSAFLPKILPDPPLGPQKNVLKYELYCIQNDQLCNTVPTKQSGN